MVGCNDVALASESVWYEKFRYEDAERQLQEHLAKVLCRIILLNTLKLSFGGGI